MKKAMKYFWLYLLIIPFVPSSVFGQDQIKYDTVFVTYHDETGSEFSFNDTVLNNLNVQWSPKQQLQNAHYHTGSEVLRGAMALMLGFGFSNSSEFDWYMPAIFRTNNPSLDWIHDIYCPGSVSKNTVKTKDANNNISFETEEVCNYSWDQGSLGYIIEKGDTIGWHTVIQKGLATDTAIQQAIQGIYVLPGFQENGIMALFELKGMFAGQPSVIFYDKNSNRLFVFQNGGLLGTLQWMPPAKLFESRKKRASIKVYVLAIHGISESDRLDLLRLAAVGMRFRSALTGQ